MAGKVGRPSKDQTIREISFDEKEQPQVEKRESPRAANFKQIMDHISDPTTSLKEVIKLIAVEIAVATKDIADLNENPLALNQLKAKVEQVKALRELSKTLQENDTISKKDVLNFDGPKFQFVFREIIGVMKKSIVKAGYSETAADEILRSFKDEMSVKEIDLRKQVDKIGNKED